MTANYEPGTVAVATVRGVPNVRVTRTMGNGGCWMSGESVSIAPNGRHVEKHFVHYDGDVTDVRPLVVIDPENLKQVERLVRAFWDAQNDSDATDTRCMSDALRSLIAPPKPPEPTGLGAVVEDTEGTPWVRTENRPNITGRVWASAFSVKRPDRSDYATYADIDAVRVLSEGVTP